jgi:hypothetical protein
MVVAQIILLSWWLNKKYMVKIPNKKYQPKRPSQNGHVQINLSKMTLWSSWTWGQNPIGGGFLLKFLVKKPRFLIMCGLVPDQDLGP